MFTQNRQNVNSVVRRVSWMFSSVLKSHVERKVLKAFNVVANILVTSIE